MHSIRLDYFFIANNTLFISLCVGVLMDFGFQYVNKDAWPLISILCWSCMWVSQLTPFIEAKEKAR